MWVGEGGGGGGGGRWLGVRRRNLKPFYTSSTPFLASTSRA